jgi:hypothetical protein
MENILAKATEWFPLVTSVIGTFAVLATITPNTTDNKIAQFLMDLVNFLGGNVGKAENK